MLYILRLVFHSVLCQVSHSVLPSHHSYYLMSYLSYYLKSDLPYYLTQDLSYLILFYVSFVLLFCLITHIPHVRSPTLRHVPFLYHFTYHKYGIVASGYKFFIRKKKPLELKKNINNLVIFKFNISTRMHMVELIWYEYTKPTTQNITHYKHRPM